MASPTTPPPAIKPEDYSHSPVHYALLLGDRSTLTKIISTLPILADPSNILTENDSLTQEQVADQISAVLDRRDVPFRETPLHLAVRLNDAFAARSLASAGADVSLHNAAGWSPLQEAICRRTTGIASILLKLHHRSAWAKWRRRLPRLISVLRRMRDFYMEISFHFESSVIPFVGKVAPSDTYKIWKRDGDLRADTSLAGFDGLKIQRADQTFLFLGDGDQTHNVSSGSLLVLNHDDRKIFDAFEKTGAPMSQSDIAGFCAQTSVYRPGMDVTKAELVGRTNWRRQDKTESVGDWKARVYEIHNVVFSFRSRKIYDKDVAGSEQMSPLELDEDDDGFLVAENPSLGFNVSSKEMRRHSSFVREERDFVSVGRKSVDIIPSTAVSRRSKAAAVTTAPPPTKEKEFVKSLRPSVWLTEQFPLKTEELIPLLDILANKVKAEKIEGTVNYKVPTEDFSDQGPNKSEDSFASAVSWFCHISIKADVAKSGICCFAFCFCFPSLTDFSFDFDFDLGMEWNGVAIPVMPTVKVVVTFTKFVELQPTEQFFTPLSSPRSSDDDDDDDQNSDSQHSSFLWSSSSTWLRRNSSQPSSKQQLRDSDPFAIPVGYEWCSVDDNDKSNKQRKSKSSRKSKQD